MLSKREIEVLKLTAWDCLSAKEVADRLNISPVTAQNHIHNIKLKENINKITELSKLFFVKYARNVGAVILILIFSIEIVNTDNSDMRTRRARRGRKYELENLEGYECD